MTTLKEKHLQTYEHLQHLVTDDGTHLQFFTVTECHQDPDAHYFIVIRITALVCKPARNSPWLCNKINNTKLLPDQSGCFLSQGYSYRSCLYQKRCPSPVRGIRTECSWIHGAAGSISCVQSVSETHFKPCRINISFSIQRLYRPMRSCWCHFASTHAIKLRSNLKGLKYFKTVIQPCTGGPSLSGMHL